MDLLEKFLFEPHILDHSLHHQICRLQSLESEFIIFYGTVYFIREVYCKQATPTHLPFYQLKFSWNLPSYLVMYGTVHTVVHFYYTTIYAIY